MSSLRFNRRAPQRPITRRGSVERLEPRHLMAATPLGVTPKDTGEFFLGSVAVTPVLFESNGQLDRQTQNWTAEEIDQTLAKVTEGVGWWSELLDSMQTVHSLDFVIDPTHARTPVQTPYEPIDRNSGMFNLYVGDFLTAQGYGDATSIEEGVQRFNVDQRERLGTDWAFTIFIVDSSDDPDGLFAASTGEFAAAFAYAGGLFLVTPSTRPASTIAHETGHIFWARDEYQHGGSWTDHRGYYNAQNLNAWDNPAFSGPNAQSPQISIMRGGVPLNEAYQKLVSPESTLAMVGWRDSDGDGVFDLADVPLQLDGVGHFDAAAAELQFRGQASAVPLINRNSSGTQSDITLNRISQLQYRLDDGPWQTAAAPDQQRVDLDVTVAVNQPFETVQWRAIDLATGIVSATISGTAAVPAIAAASISGVAFLDQDGDGQRDLTEPLLADANVVVRHSDGSALFGGVIDPDGYSAGPLSPEQVIGATLRAEGIVTQPQVGVFASPAAEGRKVFQSYDQQRKTWSDHWSAKAVFEATFDQSVSKVSLTAIGLAAASFGRLEAYDAQGNLLTRVTSDALDAADATSLQVNDPQGRITRIRAFGHAGTSVALTDLRFGFDDRTQTDVAGAWRLPQLPDGDYQVLVTPRQVIHRFTDADVSLQVVDGASRLVSAAAERVDSPYYNTTLGEDANRDGVVTSRDALVIINELNRNRPRTLTHGESVEFAVDVNNDGAVSALDALLVINQLARISPPQGGSSEQVGALAAVTTQVAELPLAAVDQTMADWNAGLAKQEDLGGFAGGSTVDESADPTDADSLLQQGAIGVRGRRSALASAITGRPAEFFSVSGRDDVAAGEGKSDPMAELISSELSELSGRFQV